jgi:predicted nucleotidyltransferase
LEPLMSLPQAIQEQQPALEALCRRYAVHRLRLFGSAVGEGFRPESSDFDFLVEFGEPVGMDKFEQYFGLRQALRELFRRDIDLVDWNAARNPYFREQAGREAEGVYGAP